MSGYAAGVVPSAPTWSAPAVGGGGPGGHKHQWPATRRPAHCAHLRTHHLCEGGSEGECGGDADHGAGQVPGDDPRAQQARSRETVARGQLGRCLFFPQSHLVALVLAFETLFKSI